jgi:sugar/nucleoside kinase (ribokinase family)
MLRLDPGEGRIRTTRSFQVWEGGGEYNVARGLRKTFGMRTSVVTALPRNEMGALAEDLILQGGVDTAHILWREADGVGRNTRMGLNFTERGFGVRGALGASDRANSAASQMQPDEVDWDALFGGEGVRWLHTGGIFAALSESTAATTLAAIRAAKRHGVVVSYDLNYRASLWSSHPDPDAARRVNREIAGLVDVLVGDEYAFESCLGIGGPAQRPGLCRHPARSGLGLGQPLGRGALGRWKAPCGTGARDRRPGPGRRRRRLRLRSGLCLPAGSRSPGRCRLWRSPRGPGHDHSGRQRDDIAGRGAGPVRGSGGRRNPLALVCLPIGRLTNPGPAAAPRDQAVLFSPAPGR